MRYCRGHLELSKTYHALDGIEESLCVEQSDGVSRNQASERVSDDAELCDVSASALNLAHFLLNFGAHALAAALDAIVGEAAAVLLGEEEVEFVARVLVSERFRNVAHVGGIAPKLRFAALAIMTYAQSGKPPAVFRGWVGLAYTVDEHAKVGCLWVAAGNVWICRDSHVEKSTGLEMKR